MSLELVRVYHAVGSKNTRKGKWSLFWVRGHLNPEDDAFRQLKRENARIRIERDILKKAVAIFSEEPLRIKNEIDNLTAIPREGVSGLIRKTKSTDRSLNS